MRSYPHSKIYLSCFTFPEDDSVVYPASLVSDLAPGSITFEPITIFYGGNGCGKSTLLNIIGHRLQLDGYDKGNESEYLPTYSSQATVELEGFKNVCEIDGRFIRSETIMSHIVRVRQKNERIKNVIRECSEKWGSGMYEALYGEGSNGQARRLSDWENGFLNKLGYFDKPEMMSNGQSAMAFFDDVLMPDSLFLLDEPENSLAPKFQKELAQLIEQYAYLLGCQFIIATHSPFLLAMDGAKVYDLDAHPMVERPWTELENIRMLHDLFKRFSNRF